MEDDMEQAFAQHFGAMGIDDHMFGPAMSHSDLVSDILVHHGIKGMKWGVHRKGVISDTTTMATPVSVVAHPGQKVKVEGGEGHAPHPDAQKHAVAKQIAKKSSTDALSTKELQDLVQRMNLEQQYSRLASEKTTVDKGHEHVKKILAIGNTAAQVHSFINGPVGKVLVSSLKK